MPAARMGDQAMCPPMGPAPIVVGCPTVLIGETGGSGGGGGGGAGSSGSSGDGSADGPATASGGGGDSSGGDAGGAEDQTNEGHQLQVQVTDQGGHAITGVRYSMTGPQSTSERGQLVGGVSKTGIPAGDYEIKLEAITEATWSAARHKVGEEIKLEVSCAGVDDGTHAVLEVYRRDTNCPDKLIHTIETSVNSDAISEAWTPEVNEELLAYQDDCYERGRYSNPFYVFKVSIGSLTSYSSLMQLRDSLEVVLKDDEGATMAGCELRILFPNGEIRSTKTDGGGKVQEDDVPCGRFRMSTDMRT